MTQVKKKKKKEEEEEEKPHSNLLTLCLTVKRMVWMMKTTPKFCHLSNFSLFLSNSRNCLDISICPLPILLLLLTSISSSKT
jgi:hypothetical protein